MPSGAKKRKAAKKKKELQVNKGAPHLDSSTLPRSHGEEDLEHHNDKDSDGGYVSSPASQDNHNFHELMDQVEEEIDKREDRSHDQSSIHEHKSDEMTNGDGEMEEGTTEEESALHLERDFKVEDEPQSENISIEYVEAPKELVRSSSSSSCSSNSEDGSSAVNKNVIVVDDTPVVDLVKEVDSLSPGKHNDDAETVFVTDLDKDAMTEYDEQVKSIVCLTENGEKMMGVVDESVKTELVKESDAFQKSHEDDAKTSDAMDFATQVIGEKVTLSHDVPNVYTSIGDEGVGKREDEAVETSHGNNTEASDAMDFATQVNGEKVNPSCDVPNIGDEEVGNKEDDEAVQTSRDNNVKTSEPKEEKGDILTLSYNGPKIESSECSYSQHQVGSALQPVQTTSWKGCCGLFELFTGSNR